jgi:hypothetical protein
LCYWRTSPHTDSHTRMTHNKVIWVRLGRWIVPPHFLHLRCKNMSSKHLVPSACTWIPSHQKPQLHLYLKPGEIILSCVGPLQRGRQPFWSHTTRHVSTHSTSADEFGTIIITLRCGRGLLDKKKKSVIRKWKPHFTRKNCIILTNISLMLIHGAETFLKIL